MTPATKELRTYLEQMASMRVGMGALPKGFHYAGIEDFVLDRGTTFESQRLTIPEFDLVKATAQGMTFRVKECFYNAQRLVALREHGEQLHYFEGIATCGLIPVHHGWVVVGGKVVDFTWRLRDNPEFHLSVNAHKNMLKDRIWGRFPENWAYIGVEFPIELILETIDARGASVSMLDDWEGGWPPFKWERQGPTPEPLVLPEVRV